MKRFDILDNDTTTAKGRVKATCRTDTIDGHATAYENDPKNVRSFGSADLEAMRTANELCTKVMLYLQTLHGIRIGEMRNHEAAARHTRMGHKNASRIERQLASRYNRIIVGPALIPGHAGGEVAPHWRRGHMRMQAHGPQHSLRKLVFIAPTLIRADRLNESGTLAR